MSRPATLIWLALLGWLVGCAPDPAREQRIAAALNSPGGQVFCRFETNGHAELVGALIAIGANAAGGGPVAGQVITAATAAGAAYAAAACAQAAANIGATSGTPVAPPASPAAVPLVPVDPAKLPPA